MHGNKSEKLYRASTLSCLSYMINRFFKRPEKIVACQAFWDRAKRGRILKRPNFQCDETRENRKLFVSNVLTELSAKISQRQSLRFWPFIATIHPILFKKIDLKCSV